MQIIGKLTKKQPIENFDTQNGAKICQEFIISVEGNYPKYVCFKMFDEQQIKGFEEVPLKTTLKVHFFAESRAFRNESTGEEKWYTTLKCFKLEKLDKIG